MSLEVLINPFLARTWVVFSRMKLFLQESATCFGDLSEQDPRGTRRVVVLV